MIFLTLNKIEEDVRQAKLYKYQEEDDTFSSSLRKAFVRYIREGPQIIDLIQGEIPSPRETAISESDIDLNEEKDEKPNLLHQKMKARK